MKITVKEGIIEVELRLVPPNTVFLRVTQDGEVVVGFEEISDIQKSMEFLSLPRK